jgi:hypothetical protein
VTNVATEKMSAFEEEAKNAPSAEITPRMGLSCPHAKFYSHGACRFCRDGRTRNRRRGRGVRQSTHPSSENSIAQRTLATPAELSTDMRAGKTAEATPIASEAAVQMATPSTPEKKSQPGLPTLSPFTDETALNVHVNSIAQTHAERDVARSVLSPGNSEVTTTMPLVKASETPAPNIQPVQRKVTKKFRVTSRYAGRETGRWGGEYYRDRDWRYGDTR